MSACHTNLLAALVREGLEQIEQTLAAVVSNIGALRVSNLISNDRARNAPYDAEQPATA
ncbi:hypothetical protein BH10PSE11_BH10PSE11_33810 [soil metagenome]